MQKYTEIDENKTLRESRELLLNNDKTGISCNSGPAFPTINLQPGMLCFRTDEQKLYQLNADGATWVELFDLSGNIGLVSRATTADNALEVNGHTVNSDVPVNAKFTDTTYGAVTDSASGLMTAAQKKKLDELSNYSLPVASATTLGGVKIGDGLTITNGILSSGVTGGNATHGEKLYDTVGSYTFTVPAGVYLLIVTCIGAGGGGGGSSAQGNALSGGAGGRGGVVESSPYICIPGQSLQVVVGGGGTGGGTHGGGIGVGGAGNPAGANGTAGSTTGGNGGRGGNINGLGGGGGGGGYSTYANSGNGGGGGGASSFAGYYFGAGGGGGGGGGYSEYNHGTKGGNGGNSAIPIYYSPKLSTTYGAGGAGGAGGNSANAGGNGQRGCVYIWW